MKKDVVIIGGGIAGLTTAKFLAEEGVDFILVEEHTDFFQKACGEGIIPKIGKYDFFEDLYESKIGIEREIDETIVHTRYGDLILPFHFVTTNKKLVEQELFKQVKKKGGEVLMGSKVRSIEGDPPTILPQGIKAKVVVGADGVRSVVRKWMGINEPSLGFAVEGRAEKIPFDTCRVEVGKDVIPYGYAWFFPKREEWNIGIGAFEKGYKKYFSRKFDSFRRRFPEVKKWRGAFLPLSKPTKTYGKRSILVGDAGSQIISSIGAGNTTSAICGKIAAEVLIKFARRDFREMDLSLYEKRWKAELGKLFSLANSLARLFFIIHGLSEYLSIKFLKRMIEKYA